MDSQPALPQDVRGPWVMAQLFIKQCIHSHSALSLLSGKGASGAFLASCHKTKQTNKKYHPALPPATLPETLWGNCQCASWQGCKFSHGCPEPWRWGGGGAWSTHRGAWVLLGRGTAFPSRSPGSPWALLSSPPACVLQWLQARATARQELPLPHPPAEAVWSS